MASGFSTFLSDKILDYYFNGGADFDLAGGSLWVAAFADATADVSLRTNTQGTWGPMEVTTVGTAYARIEVQGGTAISFSAASGGHVQQNLPIAFLEATATWGTVYTIALMDALTNGNCIAYSDLDAGRLIEAPDILTIPAGNFDITL